MATIKPVSEKQARGAVRRIFRDIKATKKIDRVPNFWRGLARHPALLEQVWSELKAVMSPGSLDVRTKEMVALAVSITNSCEY